MSAHIFSRVLGAWFAFLLPGFRTFQSVYHKPQNDAEVERWSKYWSVMAAVIAAEYTVEWLVCWFPFYWEIKTLFLLFLSLPQIQGSTWVFDSYLAPLVAKHEAQLEGHIGSAQSNMVVWVQGRISVLMDFVFNALGKTRSQAQSQAGTPGQQAAQQRTAVQGATEAVWGIWRAYGSPILSRVSDPRSSSHTHTSPPATPRSASSASSSAVNSNVGVLNARNGFIPEAQIPLPVTPNEVHKSQNPFGEASSPSFPIPQHFPETE